MDMKHNITLSLEKDLIQKARVIAAQRQTSVSRMLSQELRKIVEDDDQYQWAKRKAIANLRAGFHLGGKGAVPREEVHDRQSLR